MNGFVAILCKDLRTYFLTFSGYVVAGLLCLASGVGFFLTHGFFQRDVSSLQAYFEILAPILLVAVPAVTAGTWGTEGAGGTEEILLSLPIGDGALVIGKWCATVGFVLVVLIVASLAPLAVTAFGDFDGGIIVAQFLGLLLFLGSALAWGQFFSLVAKTTIAGFFLALGFLVALGLSHRLAPLFPVSSPITDLLNAVSLEFRFRSFARGLVDTRDVTYLLAVTGLGLFGAARFVTQRRRADG